MRGAQGIIDTVRSHGRIIPADAGSTLPRGRVATGRPDHPRGCGEHSRDRTCWHCRAGSSPRMRGAHPQLSGLNTHPGIIPADAGSTRPCARSMRSRRDHPRGCGEHGESAVFPVSGQGSSPRMRGAHIDRDVLGGDGGIIPADAGSTMRLSAHPMHSRDHPRGCGEH